MKKLFIGFLALVSATLLFCFSRSYFIPKNKPPIKTITVYQKIIKQETDNRSYDKVSIELGKTALELLQKTVPIKTKGEGKNAFIINIDNYEANNNKKEYWSFYINDQYAQVGAGSYILKDDDKIKWKIDNY